MSSAVPSELGLPRGVRALARLAGVQAAASAVAVTPRGQPRPLRAAQIRVPNGLIEQGRL